MGLKERRTMIYGPMAWLILALLMGCQEVKEEVPAKKPNILFAIADDQSYPYTSAYGTKGVETPAFDRVARNGVLFTNAFVAAPQCSPSRAAILTGRNIWQLEEAGTHASYFPKKYRVFTEYLDSTGYSLGFTGKAWGPGDWKSSGWSQNPVGPQFNGRVMDTVPATGINPKDYFGNFLEFYGQKKEGEPFFFWYGAHEPHRVYEQGSGEKAGKNLSEVKVPSFLPDHEVVRNDVADYALEVEWFDKHLGKIIDFLEEKGELDNTIIVITADNGMPFPSAKANLQEYGTHVPLAISWPSKIKGNRTVDDLVALIDVAPTFLDLTGIGNKPGMTGKSLSKLLLAENNGSQEQHRPYVLTGRERHTHARPDNLGYPARAIRTQEYLYVQNFKPELWPMGDPAPEGTTKEDKTSGFKSLWPGYHDIDDSPSKTLIMDGRDAFPEFFEIGFAKRPAEQLYDIKKDPGCVQNVAALPEYKQVLEKLRNTLEAELKKQGDPRVLGYGDIFDSYPRISTMREFSGFHKRATYNPDYLQEGQVKVK